MSEPRLWRSASAGARPVKWPPEWPRRLRVGPQSVGPQSVGPQPVGPQPGGGSSSTPHASRVELSHRGAPGALLAGGRHGLAPRAVGQWAGARHCWLEVTARRPGSRTSGGGTKGELNSSAGPGSASSSQRSGRLWGACNPGTGPSLRAPVRSALSASRVGPSGPARGSTSGVTPIPAFPSGTVMVTVGKAMIVAAARRMRRVKVFKSVGGSSGTREGVPFKISGYGRRGRVRSSSLGTALFPGKEILPRLVSGDRA